MSALITIDHCKDRWQSSDNTISLYAFLYGECEWLQNMAEINLRWNHMIWTDTHIESRVQCTVESWWKYVFWNHEHMNSEGGFRKPWMVFAQLLDGKWFHLNRTQFYQIVTHHRRNTTYFTLLLIVKVRGIFLCDSHPIVCVGDPTWIAWKVAWRFKTLSSVHVCYAISIRWMDRSGS